jgi:hypothetical protein
LTAWLLAAALAGLPRLAFLTLGAGLAGRWGRLATLSWLCARLRARLATIAFRVARSRPLAGSRFPLPTALGLRDFALQLLGQQIEFRLRHAQLLRLVAEHAFGGPFDAAF